MKFFSLYEKNVFYYQYVFNHIRSGKESFVLPSHGSSINHHSNVYILQLLNESHWASILQDLSPSGIKLYIKKQDILENFKDTFGKRISSYVQLSDSQVLEKIYQPYDILSTKEHSKLSILLETYTDTKDIERLKDRLYTIDFWLTHDYIDSLIHDDIASSYDHAQLLGIFATIKETFFGLLIYMTYLQNSQEAHQKDYGAERLLDLYTHTILQDTPNTRSILQEHIVKLLDAHQELLSLRTLLDDNQDYMYIGFNNWTSRIKQHNNGEALKNLSNEDEIWFLGYLKHMTYYNRRFLIPQH